MLMFHSEVDLLLEISKHDELVRRCVRGEVTFDEFCEKYNNFYAFYALDGHESDTAERALLERHEDRVRPHRIIALEILGQVCSEQDALLEAYKQAGRFGSVEAVARLNRVKLPGGGQYGDA